jgi:hypothetical protein
MFLNRVLAVCETRSKKCRVEARHHCATHQTQARGEAGKLRLCTIRRFALTDNKGFG